MATQYRGINSLLNGGTENIAKLHPHYQAKLEGNSSKLNRIPSNFDGSNAGLDNPGQAEAAPVFHPGQLIAYKQEQYMATNKDLTRNPTRFDVQNQGLKIGGAPLQMHRDKLGSRMPAVDTTFTIPLTPGADLSQIYPNPGVFDFGTAVRSTRPEPVTYPSETLQRMMRPVDEVDPELLTNPLPDPTFLARQPMFNHAPEDAATQRLRQQTNGPMRFW